MNTGQTITLGLHNRSIKKGDLFRVVKIGDGLIVLAAIDDACLRDNEIGVRKEKEKKPRKPKKYPQTPFLFERARVAWKKRSVLECLAIIDKENEG